MDVLRPELIWIDGRCYRRNPCRNDYGLNRRNNTSGEISNLGPPPGLEGVNLNAGGSCHQSTATVLKPYEEEDDYCDPDAPDDSEIAERFIVEKLEAGGFMSRCDDIPSGLFSIIVGAKGATKKRLEAETQTKIVIPTPNQKGDIVIRGQSKKDVIAARQRINFLASRARFQRDPTHFLCFPINSKTFLDNVKKFQELVSEKYSSSPFGSSVQRVFQDAQKLHLTISVLVLLDSKERQLIGDLLKNLKPAIDEKFGKEIADGKCKVHLKGIEIMNDDPSQVDVLYAPCLNCSTVQELADFVGERFLETGLVKPTKSKSVKLHVTLMNTRFLARTDEGSNERTSFNKRACFDARPLLESDKFRNFDFGVMELKEIHVSVRYTSNPKDGFYNSSAKINLC